MVTLLMGMSWATAQEQHHAPSLAFLAYLAELEQVDGQWLDASDVDVDSSLEVATGTENNAQEPAVGPVAAPNEYQESGG